MRMRLQWRLNLLANWHPSLRALLPQVGAHDSLHVQATTVALFGVTGQQPVKFASWPEML